MNRYTAKSRNDKVEKLGYYLKDETAKHFDYILKPHEILNRFKKVELTRPKAKGLESILWPEDNKDESC